MADADSSNGGGSETDGASMRSSVNDVGPGGDKDVGMSDEKATSVEGALFGVLYTLSKEKYGASKKFATVTFIADFLQLMVLIVSSEYAWDIDWNNWFFKAVSAFQYRQLVIDRGYTFYLVINYIFCGVLAISAVLCAWVAYCFKVDHFPVLWPIKVLRFFVSVFFGMFYMASLNMFLVMFDCSIFDKGADGAPLEDFPEVDCLSMPHMAHAGIGIFSSLLFMAIAACMTIGEAEFDLASKKLLAQPTSSVEAKVFVCKTLIVVITALASKWVKVQAVASVVLIYYMVYLYVYWQPFLQPRVNHMKAATMTSALFVSLNLIGLAWAPKSASVWTYMALGGFAPVGALGWILSWQRLNYIKRNRSKYKNDEDVATDQRVHRIFRFSDPKFVEVMMRVYLARDEDGELIEENIHWGENVMNVGLRMFPNEIWMALFHVNFVWDVQKNPKNAAALLEKAESLKPNVFHRFILFARTQEQKQQQQSQSSGEQSVDLVSYVEFQRNYKMLMTVHRQAMSSMRGFWRLLMAPHVSFYKVTDAFRRIDESQAKADKTYKMVLERYPKSVKLLRCYANFLQEVRNDPWQAARYSAEAAKQEDLQATNAETEDTTRDMTMQRATGMQVDDKNDGVIVINHLGIMQMVNKVAYRMWGYKKGELEGKNISMMMPQPFRGRHNSYLRNYMTTGIARVMGSARQVVGSHKQGHVFPVTAHITKVEGMAANQDQLFMGVLREVKVEPGIVNVWAAMDSTMLCIDKAFFSAFGYPPSQLLNQPLIDILMGEDDIRHVQSIFKTATEYADAFYGADAQESDSDSDSDSDDNDNKKRKKKKKKKQGHGKSLEQLKAEQASRAEQLATMSQWHEITVRHRYYGAYPSMMKLTLGGTESTRILQVSMKPRDEGRMLATSDAKGDFVWCNDDFARYLGYTMLRLIRTNINTLMVEPYLHHHAKWLAGATETAPTTCTCRNGATVPLVTAPKKRVMGKLTIQVLRDDDDDPPMYMIELHKSSRVQAEADRCLKLSVAASSGLVKRLDRRSAPELFGMLSSRFVGQPLANFLNVFEQWYIDGAAPQAELLDALLCRADASPGFVLRGLLHPIRVPTNLQDVTGFAGRLATRKNRACIIQVVPPSAQDLEGVEDQSQVELGVNVWRADMLSGVIEVSKTLQIRHVDAAAAMMFGCTPPDMQTKLLSEWINVPPRASATLFMTGPNAARGGTKSSTIKSGPELTWSGRHRDQQPLKVVIQATQSIANAHRTTLMIRLFEDSMMHVDCRRVVAEVMQRHDTGARRSSLMSPGKGTERSSYARRTESMPIVHEAVPPLDLKKARKLGFAGIDNDSADANGSVQRDEAAQEPNTARNIELEFEPDDDLAPLLTGRTSAGADADAVAKGGDDVSDDESNEEEQDLLGKTGDPRTANWLADIPVAPDTFVSAADGSADAREQPARAISTIQDGVQDTVRAMEAAASLPRFKEGLADDQRAFAKKQAAAEDASEDGGIPAVQGNLMAPADAASQGDSEMQSSVGDGPVGASESAADFRRGRRHKKLTKILTSTRARRTLMQLKQNTMWVLFAMLIAHTACFVAVLVLFASHNDYILEIRKGGGLAFLTLDLASKMNKIWAIYMCAEHCSTIYPPNGLENEMDFGLVNITDNVDSAYANLEVYEQDHHGMYLGYGELRKFQQQALIDIFDRPTLEYTIFSDSTLDDDGMPIKRKGMIGLWEAGNMYIAAMKDVLNRYEEFKEDLQYWRQFLLAHYLPQEVLAPGYARVLELLIGRTERNSARLMNAVLILLGVETAALLALTVYMWLLYAKVAQSRMKLVMVFLDLPRGYVRALATKQLNANTEADDDSDSDDGLAGQADDVVPVDSGKVVINAKEANKSRQREKELTPRMDIVRGVWPFFVWTAAVVTVFIMSYQNLMGAMHPLVDLTGCEAVRSRILLMRLEAMELAIGATFRGGYSKMIPETRLPVLRTLLDFETQMVKIDYEHLLYGTDPSRVHHSEDEHPIDPNTGEVPESIFYELLQGSAVSNKDLTSALFDQHGCLRRNSSTCLTEGHPLYQASRQSVDTMLTRSITEAKLLSTDPVEMLLLNSTRFQYLNIIIGYDIDGGLREVSDTYETLALEPYSSSKTMHIILYVLMLFTMLGYIQFLYKPYLKGYSKDGHRIAELLSQVPQEIDVEGMVAVATGVRSRKPGLVQTVEKSGFSQLSTASQ